MQDAVVDKRQLNNVVRAYVADLVEIYGATPAEFARASGFSKGNLSDALNGKRDVSLGMLVGIAGRTGPDLPQLLRELAKRCADYEAQLAREAATMPPSSSVEVKEVIKGRFPDGAPFATTMPKAAIDEAMRAPVRPGEDEPLPGVRRPEMPLPPPRRPRKRAQRTS